MARYPIIRNDRPLADQRCKRNFPRISLGTSQRHSLPQEARIRDAELFRLVPEVFPDVAGGFGIEQQLDGCYAHALFGTALREVGPTLMEVGTALM